MSGLLRRRRLRLADSIGFITLEESQSRQGIGVVVEVLALIDIDHVHRISISGTYRGQGLL